MLMLMLLQETLLTSDRKIPIGKMFAEGKLKDIAIILISTIKRKFCTTLKAKKSESTETFSII